MWWLLACIPLGFGLAAIEFFRAALKGETLNASPAANPAEGE
jgi:hypothetical protein